MQNQRSKGNGASSNHLEIMAAWPEAIMTPFEATSALAVDVMLILALVKTAVVVNSRR